MKPTQTGKEANPTPSTPQRQTSCQFFDPRTLASNREELFQTAVALTAIASDISRGERFSEQIMDAASRMPGDRIGFAYFAFARSFAHRTRRALIKMQARDTETHSKAPE